MKIGEDGYPREGKYDYQYSILPVDLFLDELGYVDGQGDWGVKNNILFNGVSIRIF